MEEMEKSLAKEMGISLEEFMGKVDSSYLTSDVEAEAILVRINKRNKVKESKQKDAAAWHAKVDKWLDAILTSIDQANESDENMLKTYAEDRLKNSKRKSVSLPSGKFGFRKGQPKIEHQDDVLLQYAKEANPKYVKVKESLDWSGLKKACVIDQDKMIDENGEVLPGITIHPAEQTFYVNVKEEEHEDK